MAKQNILTLIQNSLFRGAPQNFHINQKVNPQAGETIIGAMTEPEKCLYLLMQGMAKEIGPFHEAAVHANKMHQNLGKSLGEDCPHCAAITTYKERLHNLETVKGLLESSLRQRLGDQLLPGYAFGLRENGKVVSYQTPVIVIFEVIEMMFGGMNLENNDLTQLARGTNRQERRTPAPVAQG